LHSETLLAAEPFLTDDLLQRYLGDLHRVGLVSRNELGEWVVVRDLSSVTLLEIYEEGSYRLPYEPRIASVDALPAADLLERLATDIRAGLAVPLSEIFPPPARSDNADAAVPAHTPHVTEQA